MAREEDFDVRINGRNGMSPSDECFVQVFCPLQTAIFKAICTQTRGESSTLRFSSPIQTASSSEEARSSVEGLRCTMKVGWFDAPGEVTDISASGIGIQSVTPLEKGEVIELDVPTRGGDIHLKGEVMYCRSVDGLLGLFRIGLELIDADRVNSAKWQRYVEGELGLHDAA